MATQCKVCKHPDADKIETASAQGVSGHTLAKRYGMSQASIWRHTHNCVVARTLKKHEALPSDARFNSVGMLVTVANTLQRLSTSAEENGSLMTCVQAQGKLADIACRLHDMQGPERVEEDWTKHPEFRAFIGRMLSALQPFPEAARAFTATLPRKTGGGSK